MSSNPFDLERAIDQLRTETPSPEATRKATQALLKPKRSQVRPRAIAFGAVTLATAVLLWPRGVTGGAWAQIAQKTGVQTRVHTTLRAVFGKEGMNAKPYSETWVDGKRYAANMYLPVEGNGPRRIALWIRNDGKNDLFYNPMPARNGVPAWANVSKVQEKAGPYWFGYALLSSSSSIIDDVIKEAGWEVLEHKSGVEEGGQTWERYRLTRLYEGKYRHNVIAYADPETKLVRRIETLGQRGEIMQICEMDYPASIPDSTFKVEAPAGVEVRDMEQERAEVTALLKKGLGKKGKVNLRALLHDRAGGLWVLWTGGAPAGDFKYPVKVEGATKPAYGLKEFTLSWEKAPHKTKPAPGVGERLGGMAIPIWKKLDRVTVTVPVLDASGRKTGSVTFRNVPVRQIGSIYDFAEELGIR